MAKMKIEVLAAAAEKNGLSLRDKLVAYLPHYAPFAARLAPLLNMRNWLPGLPSLSETATGFSAKRKLPAWRFDFFTERHDGGTSVVSDRTVALFADTFNRYFDPDNLRAAERVLTKLGYNVIQLQPSWQSNQRALCCGRTFLSAGLVVKAREEAKRVLEVAMPLVKQGVAIVGLEPSCLLTLRDEFPAMLPGEATQTLSANAFLFEEFIAREANCGRIEKPIAYHDGKLLLHGHCHQKAFGAMDAVKNTLGLVEGLETEVVESSCCGMAGNFGYQKETYGESIAMAELSLLPAVRNADQGTEIAADGFSCRHQIKDGSIRNAKHVAQILDEALSS